MEDVHKYYRVPEKVENPSLFQKAVGIFYKKWIDKMAVENITFDIKPGEFVGYIGPNGAGKSTTIKLLTGILTPTKGKIDVLGFNPQKQRYKYTYNIGVVFGHRSLLWYDLPAIDSFYLYKDIYELDDEWFKKRVDFFIDKLGVRDIMHIPVRKLSLGQRMKFEIIGSLLHQPKIVFLDEPTIGLDVVAKEEIRDFLRTINKEEGTTVILTTHDMDDIEELCDRVMVIDKGKVLYDGNVPDIKKRFVTQKSIDLEYREVLDKKKFDKILKENEIVDQKKKFVSLRVDLKKHDVPKVVSDLMKAVEVIDINVHEPKIEVIIREVYKEKKLEK